MTHDEIWGKVTELLVEEFEQKPEKITLQARLFEDLGLDSLDSVDMIVALEKIFRFRAKEDKIKTIRTVGDIVNFIEKSCL